VCWDPSQPTAFFSKQHQRWDTHTTLHAIAAINVELLYKTKPTTGSQQTKAPGESLGANNPMLKALENALGGNAGAMPPEMLNMIASMKDNMAQSIDIDAAVNDMRRTANTALRAVARTANDARGESDDGVGVVATVNLKCGDEVMPCSWPEQTGRSPSGLCIVTDEQIEAANVPEWIVRNLRRRFYNDRRENIQAVPTSARVFLCHSMQQYVNTARDSAHANVIYDADTDAYSVSCDVRAGVELLYPPDCGDTFRPGFAAPRLDDRAARAALSWIRDIGRQYAPTLLAASELHGVGLVAAARIARKSRLEISVNQMQEQAETGEKRVGTVRHDLVNEKLASLGDDMRRIVLDEVHRRFGFDGVHMTIPLVGGLNRIVPAQMMNHETSPPMTSKVDYVRARMTFLFTRDVPEGVELTENYEKETSPEYFRWAIEGGPDPAD